MGVRSRVRAMVVDDLSSAEGLCFDDEIVEVERSSGSVSKDCDRRSCQGSSRYVKKNIPSQSHTAGTFIFILHQARPDPHLSEHSDS